MKKIVGLILVMVMLTGCSGEVLETLTDAYAQPQPQVLRTLEVSLPEDAAVMSLSTDSDDTLYLCDGYTVTTYIEPGGSLDRTLKTVTGYDSSRLTIMETTRDGLACYQCAWSAAGEGQMQVGNAVILDDGTFHYAVSVMADADQAARLEPTWQHILDSVCALSTG